MARIYTRQALLDPSMLAQDAAYRKSIVDAANQNRIQSAQSVGQGLSSFGKGLGDVIGQGIGVATRYDEYEDLLGKYGDDPMAKAAAWKFLYGGDPSAIQNYIAVKDTAAGARTADEARLKTLREQIKTASTEELRMKLIGEYNVIAAKYSDIPEYSQAETSKETKSDTTEAKTSTEDVSTEPSLKTIEDYKKHFVETKWETLDELENLAEQLRNSGLSYGDVSSLLKEIDTKKKEIQQASETAEKKKSEEEKKAAEETKKQFDKEVSDIKGMTKGKQKQDLMKQANTKADDLRFPKPFSDEDIKKAVEAPKPVEQWNLNKQGTYNYYKNGKFIKTVTERGEK